MDVTVCHSRNKKRPAIVASLLIHTQPETRFSVSDLFAWANGSSQPGVVAAIFLMPKRVALFDPLAECINFFVRASRRIGGREFGINLRYKIFVVTVLQNSFKYVVSLIHFILSSSAAVRSGRNCLSQVTSRE